MTKYNLKVAKKTTESNENLRLEVSADLNYFSQSIFDIDNTLFQKVPNELYNIPKEIIEKLKNKNEIIYSYNTLTTILIRKLTD